MRLRKLAVKIGSAAMFCASASLLADTEASKETVPPVSTTAQQRAIKHNPFTKPDFGKRSTQALLEEQQPAPQALLELRAVLYSSSTPLVNINGKILGLGEKIDGFLLQEISEDAAILSKDDVQIMLTMAQE